MEENDENKIFTFQEWRDQLNSAYYFLPNEKWYFLFQDWLPLNEPIKFQIELFFEDGKQLIAETSSVLIE